MDDREQQRHRFHATGERVNFVFAETARSFLGAGFGMKRDLLDPGHGQPLGGTWLKGRPPAGFLKDVAPAK